MRLAQLLVRSTCAVELTDSGRAFLDHTLLALEQVEAAIEAPRWAAYLAKPNFAPGFSSGQEMGWLAEAMRILRDEPPNIEVSVSSEYSRYLTRALPRGKLDLAFILLTSPRTCAISLDSGRRVGTGGELTPSTRRRTE
jgi:LysR family hca operon transcriptional activator